jgi:uncharacterized protein YdeI (YjbR/CyaY-like superfamily)
MVASAVDTSAGTIPVSQDFETNYNYLKALLKALKSQNNATVRKAVFGDSQAPGKMTKKQMKQLATFLRKVEHQYEEASEPPIPDELEAAIRDKESSDWLPWELEAIEKQDAWREELQQRRSEMKQKIEQALETVREGGDLAGLS